MLCYVMLTPRRKVRGDTRPVDEVLACLAYFHTAVLATGISQLFRLFLSSLDAASGVSLNLFIRCPCRDAMPNTGAGRHRDAAFIDAVPVLIVG